MFQSLAFLVYEYPRALCICGGGSGGLFEVTTSVLMQADITSAGLSLGEVVGKRGCSVLRHQMSEKPHGRCGRLKNDLPLIRTSESLEPMCVAVNSKRSFVDMVGLKIL